MDASSSEVFPPHGNHSSDSAENSRRNCSPAKLINYTGTDRRRVFSLFFLFFLFFSFFATVILGASVCSSRSIRVSSPFFSRSPFHFLSSLPQDLTNIFQKSPFTFSLSSWLDPSPSRYFFVFPWYETNFPVARGSSSIDGIAF